MADNGSGHLTRLFERTAQALLEAAGADHVAVARFGDSFHAAGLPVLRSRAGLSGVAAESLDSLFDEVQRTGREVSRDHVPAAPSSPGHTICFPVTTDRDVEAAVILMRETDGGFDDAALGAARALVFQLGAALEAACPRHHTQWAYLESLFANAPEAVVFADTNHRVKRVNAEFERLFGYRCAELRGGLIDDFIAPAERYDEARMLSHTVEGGDRVSMETRRRRKDGEDIDVSILGGPVYEDGSIVGIFAVYRDITYQKQTETALRESEARYRDIFEQAPVGIFQTHCDGRPLRMNGTTARMLGYESASELYEALGGAASNVYAREGVRERFLRLIKEHGQVANFQYEAKRRDGTLITVSETSRISRWHSENDFVIDGFIIDVTELREAQRKVAEKERRLRGIFDAARDMALVLAEPRDGTLSIDSFRIAEFSAGAERMLGHRTEDALGRPLLALHPAGDHERLRDILEQIARDGREVNEELHLLRSDGEEVPVLFTAHPVFGPRGQVTGIVEVAVDISERKRAESAIEASLREKEVLLQEIHHRVKNNMQIISSILSLEIGHLSDPTVKQALQVSQSRIRSMALIHEKLYQSEDLARVDIAEYIGDLCQDLKAMGASGSSLHLDLDLDELHAGVDFAIPFGLIVNELVTNAVKHAAPESGTPRVSVGLKVGADGLELLVADNGPGFPAGFSLEGGDSLGMDLVRSLAAQLAGRIEYDSHEGARLRVVVPPPASPHT